MMFFYQFCTDFLAFEADHGWRSDKSFKHGAFLHVAREINEKFGEMYSAENVMNHKRRLKTKCLGIMRAKGLSGAGWDNDLKIITLEPERLEDLRKARN